MDNTIIKIDGLNKFYPMGEYMFHALKEINLEIESGEMIAIMGRSGSGKSTLLNIIGTLDSYDSGAYFYGGKDVGEMGDSEKASLRASEIGFVNQEFLLLNKKTAFFNVALPLYFGKTPKKEISSKVKMSLSKVSVLDQMNKKITDMSGGQKQRVAIARALVTSPKLILADEPTGALDRETSKEIIACLKELNEKDGITVVIVTHDREIAEECHKIINISDGKITDIEVIAK